MSLEETKRLLRTYRITPNKLLGQNFFVGTGFFDMLSTEASIIKTDSVLDVGAGFGFLSHFVADKCKTVIAVEKDPKVAEVLRENLKDVANVIIIEGDVLKISLPPFNKVVAIPPYYLSSRLVTWLLESQIESAAMILQKEFASRLVAKPKSEDYGWLAVFAFIHANVEVLDAVPKTMFYPQPEVDSAIVSLKPWSKKPFELKDEKSFVKMVKWLFTQRNKKLGKALTPFLRNTLKLSKGEAEKRALDLKFRDKRVRELNPIDFGDLANDLSS